MIQRRGLKNGKLAYDVRVGNSPKRTFTRYQDAEDYETQLNLTKNDQIGAEDDERPRTASS